MEQPEKSFSFGKLRSLFPEGIRQVAINVEKERAWKRRSKELKFRPRIIKAA